MFVPIKFQGHSDDVLMAWSTHTNEYVESTADHYGQPCLFSVVAPDGDGLIVVGNYNAFYYTCWSIGVAPLGEGRELPRWIIQMQSMASNLYSPVIVLDVPEGTIVSGIGKGEQSKLTVVARPPLSAFGYPALF